MNKKGFTLVEMLGVITILGILVLLATPGVLYKTEEAKLTHIKNDVKVVREELETYRMKRKDGGYLHHLKKAAINDKENGAPPAVYSEEGLVSVKAEDESGAKKDFFDVSFLADSKLEGDFLADEDGRVFYTEDSSIKNVNSNSGGWHYSSLYNGASSFGSLSRDTPQMLIKLDLDFKRADIGYYFLMLELIDRDTGEVVEREFAEFFNHITEITMIRGDVEEHNKGLRVSLHFEEPRKKKYNLEIRKTLKHLASSEYSESIPNPSRYSENVNSLGVTEETWPELRSL